MKQELIVIGLFFELVGVILLTASNMSRATLERLPLTNANRKKISFYLPIITITLSSIIAYFFHTTKAWPWLLWSLLLSVTASLLPALANYCIPYTTDIGRNRSNTKYYSLNIQGLSVLAFGFILQSLGSSFAT